MKTINSEGIVTALLPIETIADMKRVMDEVKGAKGYYYTDRGWSSLERLSWNRANTYKVEYPAQTWSDWLKEKCQGENAWLAKLAINRMGENAEKEFTSEKNFIGMRGFFPWPYPDEGHRFWIEADNFFTGHGPCPENPHAKKKAVKFTRLPEEIDTSYYPGETDPPDPFAYITQTNKAINDIQKHLENAQ